MGRPRLRAGPGGHAALPHRNSGMETAPVDQPAGLSTSSRVLLLDVLLAAAAALRLVAADGDLWLDEIWSLDNLALAMTRPTLADRLPLLFHDNTHPVNTLYLALVGPGAGALAYRALSVFAGVAAVATAAAIGWRRTPLEGLISAALVAISYPMVHYSSEARGYGVMLFAALAAVWLMEAYLERPGRLKAGAFAAVSLIGMALSGPALNVRLLEWNRDANRNGEQAK